MVDKDTLKIVNDALDAVKLMNREWQGLSDDEIKDVWYKLYPLDKNNLFDDIVNGKHLNNFAHAIEQALKEKNT